MRFSHSAYIFSGECVSQSLCALWLRLSAKNWSDSIFSIAVCNASTSPMGVSNPFVPFFIRNLAPPPLQSVDMQGTPKAIASISALGIPSKSDESTNSEERSIFFRISVV